MKHFQNQKMKQKKKKKKEEVEEKKEEKKEEGKVKYFTMDEISKHNTENDCWVVVNGDVLDATGFLNQHPGGRGAILLFAGKDASAEFNMLHKPDVVSKYAPETIIGKFKEGGSETKVETVVEKGSKTDTSEGYFVTREHWSKPNNTMSLKPLEIAQPSEFESRLSGGTQKVLEKERKKRNICC